MALTRSTTKCIHNTYGPRGGGISAKNISYIVFVLWGGGLSGVMLTGPDGVTLKFSFLLTGPGGVMPKFPFMLTGPGGFMPKFPVMLTGPGRVVLKF